MSNFTRFKSNLNRSWGRSGRSWQKFHFWMQNLLGNLYWSLRSSAVFQNLRLRDFDWSTSHRQSLGYLETYLAVRNFSRSLLTSIHSIFVGDDLVGRHYRRHKSRYPPPLLSLAPVSSTASADVWALAISSQLRHFKVGRNCKEIHKSKSVEDLSSTATDNLRCSPQGTRRAGCLQKPPNWIDFVYSCQLLWTKSQFAYGMFELVHYQLPPLLLRGCGKN